MQGARTRGPAAESGPSAGAAASTVEADGLGSSYQANPCHVHVLHFRSQLCGAGGATAKDSRCFKWRSDAQLSPGRRQFGELMAGEELDFVCETDTRLLL